MDRLIPVCTLCCCPPQASTRCRCNWVEPAVATSVRQRKSMMPWSGRLWSFPTPFQMHYYSGRLDEEKGERMLTKIHVFSVLFWKKTRHRLKLTLTDFLVRHVVSSREAIFSHSHVSVEGQGENPSGWLDLRRYPRPTVSTDQRAHCWSSRSYCIGQQSVYVMICLFVFNL